MADSDGTVTLDVNIPASELPTEEGEALRNEIERFFNAHRYTFTRRLLLALEREQLVDLVEALFFRRVFAAKITPPVLRTSTVPEFLGFAGRRPTLGSALAEFARTDVEPVVLGELSTQSSGDSAILRQEIDRAITVMSELLRDVEPLPAADRDAAIDRALDPLSKVLDALEPSLASSILEKIRKLLKELAGKIAEDQSLIEEAVPLTEFIDPNPFAITGNTLAFRMRKPSADVAARTLVTGTPLREVAEFVDGLAEFVKNEVEKRQAVTRDLFLPTSGVFAEALLGRANASEKLDVTRFFNWQDSPIPHLAPAIAQLAAGSRAQEELDGTSPTVPGSVLNIVNPGAFPDPTGLSAILAAIQNGNIFRDMSKSDQLATILGNLSQLAVRTTEIAGTLSGEARAGALKSASDIAATVARLAQTPTQQGLQPSVDQPPVPDPTPVPRPPEPDDEEQEDDPPTIRTVEITLRVFVESEVWQSRPSLASVLSAILSFNPVEKFLALTRFSGQQRTFSRTAGESMAEVTVTFKIDTKTMEVRDFVPPQPRFAPSNFFKLTDTENIGDSKPEWFERLKPGATPIPGISGATLPVTDSNFKVTLERNGGNPSVLFKLEGAPYFPLTAESLPNIPASIDFGVATIDDVRTAAATLITSNVFDLDANIRVTFDKRADGTLMAMISGSHDAFPSYEVYVNDDELRYEFTPTADNAPEDLSALAGRTETILQQAFPVPPLTDE